MTTVHNGWQLIDTMPADHMPRLVWAIEYGRVVAFVDVTGAWWPCPATEPLPSPPTHWLPLPYSPNVKVEKATP